MIDQGSGAEIIYLDLYKGLGLKVENLTKYDIPLVGFDEKIMMLEGQIMLLVVIEGKKVIVNFIVVNAFSPYTAILARPWIHTMGVVLSTLHANVKFPIEQRVVVVKGDQKAIRQCLVAVINHEIKQKGQAESGSL